MATEITMTPAQWAAVPDHPRQRDTAARARKARHLFAPRAVHAVVHAVKLPDGSLWKLDGHTRGYLWATGAIAPPEQVRVVVVPADSEEDALDLYWCFDTPEAAKHARDYLHGALRSGGVNVASRWLLRTLYSALALVERRRTIRGVLNEAIVAWQPEIEWLDSFDLVAWARHSGMTAALLLRARSVETARFIEMLPSRGTRINGRDDAIAALARGLDVMRASGTISGLSHTLNIAGKCLRAIDAYAEGITFSCGLKGYDFMTATRPRLRAGSA